MSWANLENRLIEITKLIILCKFRYFVEALEKQLKCLGQQFWYLRWRCNKIKKENLLGSESRTVRKNVWLGAAGKSVSTNAIASPFITVTVLQGCCLLIKCIFISMMLVVSAGSEELYSNCLGEARPRKNISIVVSNKGPHRSWKIIGRGQSIYKAAVA